MLWWQHFLDPLLQLPSLLLLLPFGQQWETGCTGGCLGQVQYLLALAQKLLLCLLLQWLLLLLSLLLLLPV